MTTEQNTEELFMWAEALNTGLWNAMQAETNPDQRAKYERLYKLSEDISSELDPQAEWID